MTENCNYDGYGVAGLAMDSWKRTDDVELCAEHSRRWRLCLVSVSRTHVLDTPLTAY